MESNQNRKIETVMLVVFAILWGIICGGTLRLLADLGIIETLKINQVIFWI